MAWHTGGSPVTPLVPGWAILGLFGLGVAASVCRSLQLPLCSYHQSRWILTATVGTLLAACIAPSWWISLFLVALALSQIGTIYAFRWRWIFAIEDPLECAGTLGMVALWAAGLAVLVAALRQTGPAPMLAMLLAAAGWTSLAGVGQVLVGRPRMLWTDQNFGIVNTPIREPMGWLQNVWKASALNAMAFPVGLALLLAGWWPLALLLGLIGWQLVYGRSLTCLAAAAVGSAAVAAWSVHPIAVVIGCTGSLTAYPWVRSQIRGDPRWEAWEAGWRLIRRNRGIGMGLCAWAGLKVELHREQNRVWLHLHNDWLELLLEGGVLTLLPAVALAVSILASAHAGMPPMRLGVYGSLVSLLVLSLGYMPFRTWPLNLMGIGLLAAWLA